jgi:hypothetical protein
MPSQKVSMVALKSAYIADLNGRRLFEGGNDEV